VGAEGIEPPTLSL